MDSIVVVMTHNFNRETKVFSSLAKAQKWADGNGFTLVPTKSPTVYRVTF